MFIYSLRASTLKFIAVVIISIGLLITLISILPSGLQTMNVSAENKPVPLNYKNIKTNDDRVNFIKQFGWEVKADAEQIVDVVIPKEFDIVYTKYNDVQKQQKFDLSKHKNKTVKRYTYSITNYPDYDGTVYINLLVYKDAVIGGDVCSADMNGFMHGFETDNKPLY